MHGFHACGNGKVPKQIDPIPQIKGILGQHPEMGQAHAKRILRREGRPHMLYGIFISGLLRRIHPVIPPFIYKESLMHIYRALGVKPFTVRQKSTAVIPMIVRKGYRRNTV